MSLKKKQISKRKKSITTDNYELLAQKIKEFDLVYPKDHHQKHLAGKKVDFEVKIKEVYERNLPTLNEELAQAFGLKTLDELKNNLKESLLQEKRKNVDLKNESLLISKIAEDTKFSDFPDVLLESEANNLMAELEQSVIRQGGKFDDYLNHLKKTKDELKLEMMPNAVKRVKAALIIREIAVIEKIFPNEEEINNKLSELKTQYVNNQEITKMLQEPGYVNYLQNILTNEKVIAQLKKWNYANTGSEQKS